MRISKKNPVYILLLILSVLYISFRKRLIKGVLVSGLPQLFHPEYHYTGPQALH